MTMTAVPGSDAVRNIDSLTIFSYAWAAQSLVQLVFFRDWLIEGNLLGYIFAALAIAVFIVPGRLWLFVAMVTASLVYFVSEWPFVVNHVFIDQFISATMLIGFAIIAVSNLRSGTPFDRETAEKWFMKFAPVAGAIFAFMYLSIIISKMNTGFFDLEISCLTGMIEEAQEMNRPLVAGPLSLFSVDFFFWVFIVAETLLPFMLFFRRTRLAAFYFGVPFHILLGLMGHWPFSAFMISLYVLVAMPSLRDVARDLFGRLDELRKMVLPQVPGWILFSLGNAVLLASVVVLKPSWIWLVWTTAISAALIVAVLRQHMREGIFSEGGVTPMWTAKPGLLWVALALVVVNSASPYIGFKTESNVAMYSNMRTEGGLNNHLFMPHVELFPYQDDLVEIVDSNNPEILDLKAHPARYGFIGQEFDTYIPFVELRRKISGLDDPDLEMTYIRDGQTFTFRRGADDNAHEALDKPLPLLLGKLVYLRPVFKGELSYCLH